MSRVLRLYFIYFNVIINTAYYGLRCSIMVKTVLNLIKLAFGYDKNVRIMYD